MALVLDPDFNIIQQSHGLLVIAKLLVLKVCKAADNRVSRRNN